MITFDEYLNEAKAKVKKPVKPKYSKYQPFQIYEYLEGHGVDINTAKALYSNIERAALVICAQKTPTVKKLFDTHRPNDVALAQKVAKNPKAHSTEIERLKEAHGRILSILGRELTLPRKDRIALKKAFDEAKDLSNEIFDRLMDAYGYRVLDASKHM